MSIALDYSSRITEIQPSRYTAAAGLSFLPNSAIFDSPVDRSEEDVNECSTSSSCSSIGKNSDLSQGESSDGEDENEVQSNFKRTLDSMDSLELALPMRKGISMFYNGKSKSFTSLAEASSSSSIKEIAKAENAYTRKRRNLLAFSHVVEKNRSFPLRSNGGGISKRPISSSKSTLALAVAMSSSESIMSSTSDDSSNSKSPPHLPPLHPRSGASHHNLTSLDYSPWRSFSVADLQHCVSTTSDKIHH
ncbi:protein OXIDATIVE STRESS 3 LIKE 1 [Euphorbia lathyris]|uniref:protein OXIDATIVE STRESS 3 LIKE 1 n=1 Tax=Euphorbia lathyris TaxID=212925 RepID=UPI003313684E